MHILSPETDNCPFWIILNQLITKLNVKSPRLTVLKIEGEAFIKSLSIYNRICFHFYWCGWWSKGVEYLTSPGRPTDTDLQLGKTCYLAAGKGSGCYYFFCFNTFIHLTISLLVLSFICASISSISFLSFSGRRHKMTDKGWGVVKPLHNNSLPHPIILYTKKESFPLCVCVVLGVVGWGCGGWKTTDSGYVLKNSRKWGQLYICQVGSRMPEKTSNTILRSHYLNS